MVLVATYHTAAASTSNPMIQWKLSLILMATAAPFLFVPFLASAPFDTTSGMRRSQITIVEVVAASAPCLISDCIEQQTPITAALAVVLKGGLAYLETTHQGGSHGRFHFSPEHEY